MCGVTAASLPPATGASTSLEKMTTKAHASLFLYLEKNEVIEAEKGALKHPYLAILYMLFTKAFKTWIKKSVFLCE